MSPASTTVINLARDAERLTHMRKECEAAGLSMQRFEAIRGDAIPAAASAMFGADAARLLSPGEMGCYASHISVIQGVASGDIAAPALVFEDDVRLAPDFARTLEDILSNLPLDWDLVRLSNNPKHACMNLATVGEGRRLVRYSNVPGSAGAVLWSKAGAQKFLRPPLRLLPVDQDLRRVWIWDLNTFGVSPAPVERDIFDVSSIDSFAMPGWRAKQSRVKLVRRQRALEVFKRHRHGIGQFGLAPWLSAEIANFQSVFVTKERRSAFLMRRSMLLSP